MIHKNKKDMKPIFNKVTEKSFESIFLSIFEENTEKSLITFVNPYSSIVLSKQDDYLNLLNEINYLFVDGILQVKVLNLFFKKNIQRYSFDFSSIADFLFDFCSNQRLSVSFLGGKNVDMEKFITILNKRYSNLNIKGSRSGFFENENELHEHLKQINCDLLIIGMGTPLQEKVSLLAKEYSNCTCIITCGGFISQTAKKEDYYYPWIKKTGLRWLQRAIAEPHYRSRLFREYPQFIWATIRTYFSQTTEKND